MRIQWKVTLLVLLTLVGTLTAVVWKTRSSLIKDKLDFMADSSMKQITPLKRLVQERLEDQKSRLVKFAATRTQAGAGKAKAFGGFDVIALVQPTSAPAAGQAEAVAWAPSWVEKGSTAKADQWPANYEQTLLKSLPFARVKDGETVWARVSDRQGSAIYAMLISVEIQAASPAAPSASTSEALPDSTDYRAQPAGSGKKAIVVGFSAQGPLANVTDDYIGSTSVVYLVDDKGYVASHVNKSYLGASFVEDPVVQEIVKAKKTAASGNYDDLEGHPVLSHFEKIDRTNLYAIISTPLAAVDAAVNAQTNSALQTGAAVGFIGLILAFLLGRGISQPLDEAARVIRALNRGEPHVVHGGSGTDEIGTLMRLLAESSPTALQSKVSWTPQHEASQVSDTGTTTGSKIVAAEKVESDRLAQERRMAYEVFSEGFAKAIREPLMAILGHAQLSKSKTESTEVRSHAESIERESRRAQDVLDRLANWTNGPVKEVPSDQTVDVSKAIEQALAVCEAELKADGVEITKEIHAVPQIHGSEDTMRGAILHLLENAREAMRARPVKKLRIQLDFLSDKIYLVVGDSGVGMSRDVKDRAFDPFFKEFQSPKRLGLGLSFVQSAFKALGGTVEIESTPGDGATFTLSLPVRLEEKAAFQRQEAEKLGQSTAGRFAPSPENALLAEQVGQQFTPDLQSPLAKVHDELLPPPVDRREPVATATASEEHDDGDEKTEFDGVIEESTAVNAQILSQLLTAASLPREARKQFLEKPSPPKRPPPPPTVAKVEVPPPVDVVEFETMPQDIDASPIATEPPAGASVAKLELESSPTPEALSLESDDDDDNEMFANVSISRLGTAANIASLGSPEPSPTESAPPKADATKSTGFQVKIRRPRIRS